MEKSDAIRKVRGLLAQADSTAFVHEATQARAKVTALREAYSITDDDLQEQEPGLLDGMFDGMFSKYSDPIWIKLQEDERKLFASVAEAIEAAVKRAESVVNIEWRAEYLQRLHEHVRRLKDDYRYVKGDDDKWHDIDGVRRARDKAIAELFTEWATWHIRQTDLYDFIRKDMEPDEWRDYVKEKAIDTTAGRRGSASTPGPTGGRRWPEVKKNTVWYIKRTR